MRSQRLRPKASSRQDRCLGPNARAVLGAPASRRLCALAGDRVARGDRADWYRGRGRLDILAERPGDLAVRFYLGRLCLEIGDAEEVIELIGAAHRSYPRLLDFQDLLLDALFALGRDEADFEWMSGLRIFRLDQRVIDRCYEYLKRKRRPRYDFELEHLFSSRGCCRFTDSELFEALSSDPRFVVEDGRFSCRRRRDAPRCRCGAVSRPGREGSRR